QCCRDGAIDTFDGRIPINPDLWKNWRDNDDPGHAGYGPLQIELGEGVPVILPRFRYGESLAIGFSPAGVMRCFPPNWEHRSLDEAAANAERPACDQGRDDGALARPGASTSEQLAASLPVTRVPLLDYWISKGARFPPPNPPEKFED